MPKKHTPDPYLVKLEEDTKALSSKLNSDYDLTRCFLYGTGEEYTVRFIKNYLITKEQLNYLYDHGLSIEDLLNGRFPIDEVEDMDHIFQSWNEKLGFKHFY